MTPVSTLAKYSDIMVNTGPDNIQNLVRQAFEINGFRVNWEDNSHGKAEKGSKGANILLGALATHHQIGFEISNSAQGANLRLLKIGSGASGGLLGMRSANKQFDQLTDTLASWFKQQGILIDVRKI